MYLLLILRRPKQIAVMVKVLLHIIQKMQLKINLVFDVQHNDRCSYEKQLNISGTNIELFSFESGDK
jgi:hypothetical protein